MVEQSVSVDLMADAIAALEADLWAKDDIIQAQYAEIQELRRHLDLATEGVKHWMRLANAGSAISFSDGRAAPAPVDVEAHLRQALSAAPRR
jgi:hypothetical protein